MGGAVMITSHTLCNERIAELEAEVEKAVSFGQACVASGADWMRRAEKAEAELAALNARCCESCNFFPHYHICKKDHRSVRWDTFYCSEWELRP
jgi:hypothetical protein